MTALILSAMPARSQTFTTPLNISDAAPGGLPLIAVDSKDNIDVAWEAGKGVFFTRSTDQGKTFAGPVPVSTGVGGGRLQLNVDGSGNIYLLWQGSDMHFRLSRSADGVSFSGPTDLTAALSMGTFSASLPTMALDNAGNVNLVWPQYGATGAVLFSRSSDGGATFSTPVEIGKFVYGAAVQIGLGPQGDINVLWAEETTQTGGTCALHFSRSNDSGTTFSPGLTLNTADGECDAKLSVDTGDKISIVSFDGSGTFYRSTDGGNAFTKSQNIFQPTVVWFGGQLASSQGNIGTAINSFPNHDILVSRSSNQGTTFSAPILVSAAHATSTPGGAFGANDQSLVVDRNGNINVVWQDDILMPGSPDIFFSRSTDAGGSFSAAQNVSHSPGAGSPRMATDSGGNIDVVWAANDAGQVFFSRALVSQPADGFTISVTPTLLTVLPGGTASAHLTVTATGGFAQVVTLSCGNLPPSVQCSFTPPTVTPTESGALGTVTISAAPTLSTGGFPFTVNAFSPTISQFQSMQITVGVLTGSVTPTAATIPLGGSAAFGVTVASTTGFGGQFGLACNAPVGVTCTFSPASASLPINGRSFSTLTVQVLSTPAAGSAPKNPQNTFPLGLPRGQIVVLISGMLLLLAGASAWEVLRRKESGGLMLARTMASVFVSVGLTVALGAILLSCAGTTNTNRNRSMLGSGTGAGSTGGTSGISGTGGVGGTGGSTGAGGITNGGVNTPGSTSITFPLTVEALAGASVVNVGTISVTVP